MVEEKDELRGEREEIGSKKKRVMLEEKEVRGRDGLLGDGKEGHSRGNRGMYRADKATGSSEMVW